MLEMTAAALEVCATPLTIYDTDTTGIYKDLIESSFDGMFVCEYPSGCIVEINEKGCQLLGSTKDELVGDCLWERFAELDVLTIHRRLAAKLNKEMSCTSSKTYTLSRKDGSVFRADVSGFIREHALGRYLIGSFRDMTLHDDLVRSLQHAQKIEAIGTLAGGIAHDINNLLFPIIGNAELARLNQTEPEKAAENIDAIIEAAIRTRDLVQQILVFGQPETGNQVSSIKIQSVMKEIVKLFRAILPATIQLQTQFCPDCAPVLATPSYIYQIIMNLCTNAIKAMEDSGGILEIKLEPVDIVEADRNAGFTLAPGQYARITIGDTGCGMDDETLRNIFKPYFTTRGDSGGHGIGLSLIKNIVISLNGDIRVYSEKDFGSSFMVFLPIVGNADLETTAKPKTRLLKGTESILVIDDDSVNIDVFEKALRSLGYSVDSFFDAQAALDHFAKAFAAYDLVITDMTMPLITGDILIGKIRQIRPDIPIILCSGHERHKKKKIDSLNINAFMPKPVTLSHMAATIRSVLPNPQEK